MAAGGQNAPAREQKVKVPAVQPLENGDQLAASEFMRRYEAMPHIKKAELIEGVVYMGSPVRLIHAEPDTIIQTCLGYYAAQTPGTLAASNATVRFDSDNVLQPDALLRLLPECGGRSRVDADGYLNGPPELIVEIAASSASIDLRDKLRVYRRSGVSEYLVWRTEENKFDWFMIERDRYEPNQPTAQGVLESRIFPGLRLDIEALLAQNAAKVMQVLQEGLRSGSHGGFANDLTQKRQALKA